jgi:DnaK suppressor protein
MALTRKHRNELERAIEKRRAALQAEIHADAAKSREDVYSQTAGAVTDLGDEATADLIADIENAELSRDLQELRALDAALARLGDGSYGVCGDCGRDIDLERLRHQFAAFRCFDCQRVHEKTYAEPGRATL